MIELSVVIPIRNEAESLDELYRELTAALEAWGRSYEILVIDDGSTDDSFAILARLQAADSRWRVIRFRRNFGQTAAFSAGFAHARGRYIVTSDGDLQNDPRDIESMVQKLDREGFDIVAGWRRRRQDTFVNRRLPSIIANWIISRATGVALHDYGCSLKVFRAEIVKQIIKLALSGYGDLRLVRKLNDEKVPVISGHQNWTNAYVSKILRTQALLGHYEPGVEQDGKRVSLGEVWENYFPAVITLDDWHLLRAARQSRTYQRGPVGDEVANLFTGLLRNPRDGQPYQRIVKNHARLVSASYRNGLSGGDTLTFPYKPLENAFLFALAHDIKLQDLFGPERTVHADRVAVLTAELETLKAKAVQVKEAVKASGI